MANTFLKAQGIEIGNSIYEKTMLKTASSFIENYADKILLPEDVIVLTKDQKKKNEAKPTGLLIKMIKFLILVRKQG